MTTIVSTSNAPDSSLYSQGVKAGPFLFVSGMTGVDGSTGQMVGTTIREQTRQALSNCMNEAYAQFFTGEPPTRAVTKLGVELQNVLVSIMMTAYLDAAS